MSKNSAKRPKVSVVSISYNQQDFIAQTLESFLTQETNFDFEVIIADDCSSDKTAQIIEEYAKRFPDIVKPVLRKKNVGIQNNMIDALSRARGEYIALCEGDDFWTDPTKLQRQADYLDAHVDAGICFHPVKVFYEKNERDDEIFPAETSGFSVTSLLGRNFIQTNSVMYRKRAGYENMPRNILPMDWYLHLYHAKGGKVGFINRVMSAYRRHEGGVWWGNDKNADELYIKHGSKHMELYGALYDLFPDKASRRIIQRNSNSLFDTFLHVDERQGSSLVESALQQHPRLAYGYLRFLNENLDASNHRLIEQEKQRVEEVEILRGELDSRDDELRRIKSSRVWKLREGVVSLRRRGK